MSALYDRFADLSNTCFKKTQMPILHFDESEELLRCRRAGLVLLPRQHRSGLQRRGKRNESQRIREIAKVEAQRRADAVLTMLAAFRVRLNVAATSIFSYASPNHAASSPRTRSRPLIRSGVSNKSSGVTASRCASGGVPSAQERPSGPSAACARRRSARCPPAL